MEVLLMKKTKDSDLSIGTQVCYKDLNGVYSKIGVIDTIYDTTPYTTYGINTAIGSYTADELKLIKY